jgi:hypothetical protein
LFIHLQWSHTLSTWRYPEVLLAQEQQKAKHLSSIGSPLSPEQTPPASVSFVF